MEVFGRGGNGRRQEWCKILFENFNKLVYDWFEFQGDVMRQIIITLLALEGFNIGIVFCIKHHRKVTNCH